MEGRILIRPGSSSSPCPNIANKLLPLAAEDWLVWALLPEDIYRQEHLALAQAGL